MPFIYVSEWVAGRFDCGCTYKLVFKGYTENFNEGNLNNFNDDDEERAMDSTNCFYLTNTVNIQQWEGKSWQKVSNSSLRENFFFIILFFFSY